MALTPQRKGEIAYAFMKAYLRKRGIPHFNADELLRKIENEQNQQELKDMEITEGEAIGFARGLLRETFEDLMDDLRAK